MRNVLVCGVLLIAGCAASRASEAPRIAVVELFTSEGCSSCPPADALLGELAARPGVLALSFHVDYWDGLGWRDPYGIARATSRQRAYGTALHLDSIFTPQMVIDGTASFVGSDRQRIERRLKERAVADIKGPALTLAVTQEGVHISAPAVAAAPSGDVVFVAYRRSAVSAVGRGENAGRTLTEFNIVRDLRILGRYAGTATEFEVSAKSLPSDTTDVAVLVQEAGQGAVFAAAWQPIHPAMSADTAALFGNNRHP